MQNQKIVMYGMLKKYFTSSFVFHFIYKKMRLSDKLSIFLNVVVKLLLFISFQLNLIRINNYKKIHPN